MVATMETLTLYDYSDRELLHIVRECRDPDTGYASTKAIAETLGMDGENALQCVGARLAWLRRWGAVSKHRRRSLWAVTTIGEELIDGELTERQRHLVEDIESDGLLMLTRAMTRRYRRAGVTASHLIRREWKRGTTY